MNLNKLNKQFNYWLLSMFGKLTFGKIKWESWFLIYFSNIHGSNELVLLFYLNVSSSILNKSDFSIILDRLFMIYV